MLENLRTSLKATSIIIGTIIGVGIFGLPYAINKVGFFIAIPLFVFLSLTILCLHLLYGEIVLRTKKTQRLVGYAEKYLGKKAKTIATFTALFGLLGSQLAYLIVGGEFLKFLSKNVLGENLIVYAIIFLIIGSLIILKDSNVIASFEFLMSLFLVSVILLIFFSALPEINLGNFNRINPTYAFAAYGVILYSLSGMVAIPETVEYLRKKKKKNVKKVIVTGTLLPHFLCIVFAFSVIGLVGSGVSESAITSLTGFLGNEIVIVGAIFGIIAVLTSFITIGSALMKILWYDYKLSKTLSWIVVSVVPFILFILGFRNFVNVIGVVGAVMGGINGILVIMIFKRAKKRGDQKSLYNFRLSSPVKWTLITVFSLGILYELYYFISTR
jgi:tyrosine-specific transport protein